MSCKFFKQDFFPGNTYIGYSGKQEFKIQDVDIDNDVTKRNRKPNKRYMYDDYEYYGDDYDDVPQRPLKVPKVKEKEKDAVFKLKVEGQKDPDFIEVDLPRKLLTLCLKKEHIQCFYSLIKWFLNFFTKVQF